MTEHKDNELYLLLGRMQGQLESIFALVAQTSTRMENLESRLNKLEQGFASVSTSNNNNKNWLTYIASFGAVIVSVVTAFLEGT